MYTRVFLVYIKAWKQLTAEESSGADVTAIAFIIQLQETAKKSAEEAALLKDSQEGQEDDNISNLSDRESLNKESKLISVMDLVLAVCQGVQQLLEQDLQEPVNALEAVKPWDEG